MTGSLTTKLLGPALGLALVAGFAVLAPHAHASCGDYVQIGSSAPSHAGMELAKRHAPTSSHDPDGNLPCSGPNCRRQPSHVPIPEVPTSSSGQPDQWAYTIANIPIPLADRTGIRQKAESLSFPLQPFRIERPPRFI